MIGLCGFVLCAGGWVVDTEMSCLSKLDTLWAALIIIIIETVVEK